MADTPRLSEKAQKALKLFEDGCLTNRQAFVDTIRRRQRSYRAVLERTSGAAQWTSKLHPPFVQHIVESTLAGIVDDRLKYSVKPKPRFYNPGEYDQVKAGARAHEILHNCQLKHDRYNEKIRPIALQDAICGISVCKNFWRRTKVTRPRLEVEHVQITDEGDTLPRLVEKTVTEMAFDGPTTEVVNVEDFYWHEAATELQKAPVVAHDVWMSFTELKRLESEGVFQNVDQLKDVKGNGDAGTRREIDGSDRAKDMIRVTEIWWQEPEGVFTVTLGNRAVELKSPRKNPFWHGQYPFVVITTRPDMFAIPGFSQVEKIEHLQEAYWDLENQTRDNVRLLNNAIFWFDASRVQSIEDLVHEPGARWPVEGPVNQAIGSWTPEPMAAGLALPHLSRLERSMQNLAGGQPFTSTSESDSVGANTATEASLVTNLAQRATLQLRMQLNYGHERNGQQRTELNQQFIRTPLMVDQIGLDSEQELVEIAPMLLQGDYLFDIQPMNESLMRQERRAEANALLQVLGGQLPVWVGLSRAGAATPPNFDEMIRFALESYDIDDPQRFFSDKPMPPVPQPGQQQGDPSQGGGVTGPGSIDPSVSPSAEASMSGATPMARYLSGQGGANNSG